MHGLHSHSSQPTRRLAVGTIARAHGATLRVTAALSAQEGAVLRALEQCRTPALGGRVEVCSDCGHRDVRFHSCRNRHCPTCHAIAQHRWLESRRERLLETPYFHCVFTVPEPLRWLFLEHRRVLFEAVRQTLLAFAHDPDHLGATPAITAGSGRAHPANVPVSHTGGMRAGTTTDSGLRPSSARRVDEARQRTTGPNAIATRESTRSTASCPKRSQYAARMRSITRSRSRSRAPRARDPRSAPDARTRAAVVSTR